MLLPKICELFSIPPLNRPIGEVPYEAERVKRAGGMVVKWDGTQRVAKADYEEKMRELRRAKAQGLGTIGQPPVALAVSRAMGDRDFKEADGLGPLKRNR
eukprot:g30951.t1